MNEQTKPSNAPEATGPKGEYQGFSREIDRWDWDATGRFIGSATDEMVRAVLAKAESNRLPLTPEEFGILISVLSYLQICRHFARIH